MAIAPIQRQRKSCLYMLLTALILLIIAVAGIAAFTLNRPTPQTPHATPTTHPSKTSVVVSPTSTPQPVIGVTKTSTGELIGISDGSSALDISSPRTDSTLKQRAADAMRTGDLLQAKSLWNQAAQIDTNDAEVLIYLENQRILNDEERYITLVVGTMLSGRASALSTGRDILQGAYVAQREANDGQMLPGGVQIRLLIANAGGDANNVVAVAQQVVQAAQQDNTIAGVMGWPFSAYALKAAPIFDQAKIPIVSPTASSDQLTGISSFFFRVAPSNKSQAAIAATYVKKRMHSRHIAVFIDSHNPYSNDLANDFSAQFAPDQIVVTEQYTVGDTQAIPGHLQHVLSFNPDLLYFAGYTDDLGVLLSRLPSDQPDLQIMGGDALYELEGYPPSARAGFNRLRFTAFAYPDEWGAQGLTQPKFFTNYPEYFDPKNTHPTYGYDRPTNDAILGHDATLALLQGCINVLSGGSSPVTPGDLQQGLVKITGDQAIQGVSGQISFGSDGDPVNKAVVMLIVVNGGFIQLAPNNDGIQGCFLKGNC